jgi:salicylate hydroxylase
MEDTKAFTLTIIGGGIGGLTLAAGLLRRNVRVQIYEAASAFSEIGLGLSIGPAAHRAMPLIDPQIRDIYDSLVTTHADSPGYEAFRQTWFEVVWASGEKEGDLLMDLKALPSGQTTLRRADFLDALVGLVPKEIVHFGKRLDSLLENGDGVELRFDDGSVVSADVVVGCDGIKSKVKESMLPDESRRTQPRYSGMYGYRAVLDMQDMVDAVGDQRARVSTMYIGEGAYGISYPIMRAQKVNVGVYVLNEKWDCETWVRKAKREDMLRDTENMGRYVKSLVEVSLIPDFRVLHF